MKLNFITTCITLIVVLNCTLSCTKKELPPKKEDVVQQPTIVINTPVKPDPDAEKNYIKMMTGNLKFLGSLEKEVLKVLLEDKSPEVNQFEVLAYGFDKFNGVKTGFLAGFGCQKIAVKALPKRFEVFSECTKPAKKLAEVSEVLGNKNRFTIVFLTPNWKVILGNAAGINPERTCEIVLKENKVQLLDCKDTVFSPRNTGLDINLLELKIRKYVFNRNQSDELVIEGGQYKDLIEIKKINMTVPMTGKISIIEKELKVKDDFAEMQNKPIGVEEKKQEVKNEEESAKKEEKPHTAEPEYIGEKDNQQENIEQTTSGTAKTQNQEQNQQGQSLIAPDEPQPQQQKGQQPVEEAPPGEADPGSVPPTPPPQQQYGR